jgi:hypothetical protein
MNKKSALDSPYLNRNYSAGIVKKFKWVISKSWTSLGIFDRRQFGLLISSLMVDTVWERRSFYTLVRTPIGLKRATSAVGSILACYLLLIVEGLFRRGGFLKIPSRLLPYNFLRRVHRLTFISISFAFSSFYYLCIKVNSKQSLQF